MHTGPENVNNPDYTDPSFQNLSKTYDEISEYGSPHNLSVNGREKSFHEKVAFFLVITICIISIFGAVGNGMVIWLLGFRIKRNSFMTYGLNLAVADFGFLLSFISLGFWYISYDAWFVFVMLFQLTYSASQYLLTAISVDRCVAVLFPLWYQCKRPPHLPTLVCAVIWVLSILLTGITCTLSIQNIFLKNETELETFYQFMVNAVLCLPVMMIATVALFLKVCLKAQQHQRERLLTIILLTLLFFILIASPLNNISFIVYHTSIPMYMILIIFLLACLNSSINPVIYFLVGRQWKSRRRESMKTILQEVFKEKEGCIEKTSI